MQPTQNGEKVVGWEHVGWRDKGGLAWLNTAGLHDDLDHKIMCKDGECEPVFAQRPDRNVP
jgi:hypothetical protein